ncbi:MAG: 1-acyl-sn-glycerol-3-phosphate acyltransferase [Bacteroidales bacterium]|nr:1-acyl-sn-glycerol-3-phosphate acyltransferase [Bacteroidales bacterium]
METTSKIVETINIRKIFHGKNPSLARLLPGFVFRYLEKIVHQEDINAFLNKHGHKTGVDFIKGAIEEFNIKLTVENIEKVPVNGRYIFAANHPLGGFDGMMMMNILGKNFGEFRSLSNDLLMNITNLQPVFLPVNKHGRQDAEAAAVMDEVYRSNIQILTFPAGLVSRRIKGQIVDLEWKKNFISKAIQYKRDIVPVHISGRNSEFFYRLGSIRRFLGIKANLEMFYLVDETFKHKNKSITIKFSPPISYEFFDKSKKPIEWAKWVKEKVYELDGVYHIPL